MKNKKLTVFLASIGTLCLLTALNACSPSANHLPPILENTESLENSSVLEDSSFEISSEEETEIPEIDSSTNNSISSSVPESSPPESSVTQPSTPVSTKAQYIRCTGNRVNIRSGAGTEFSVLGSAEAGTMYALIEKKGNWYKTYYRNKAAYIYASYAQVVTLEKSNNTQAEKVIQEGYKLIGTPYVYGAVRLHNGEGKLLSGFTVQKFDCSSLIQYMFYHGAAKNLGMHTRAQVKQGKYVHPNNLQRGDCIFFTNEDRQYNSGIERVGHVAIYLGNNYILHTASDYARIEKMTASRWNFYIEARRFV